MSNPTTPFGWQMPENTDLVTDLPADFEVFGQAVATSMADLLGGTTGQVLAKASNTDMDFTFTTLASGGMTLLSTTTLTGASTTVSSINQTYKNLQIMVVNAYSSGANNDYFQLNGDTGSNYGFRLNSDGVDDHGSGVGFAYFGVMGQSQGYYAGTYISITIPRYSETEYKMTNFIQTQGNSFYLGSNTWNNTAAITAITIGVSNAQTMSGGTMYIYGVK